MLFKSIVKSIIGIVIIGTSLISSTVNSQAYEATLKAYPDISEGGTEVNGAFIPNAIKFIEGTTEKNYYDSMGIYKLWFHTSEGGFGAYTPELKTHSPLWLKNPGIIYQNTQIGKDVYTDHSGTQVRDFRTLKWGRVDPNDQSLDTYRENEGTTFIQTAPFEGTDDLIGNRLDFRFLGHSESGTIISNPHFPADNPSSTTNAEYNWDGNANLSAFGFEPSQLDMDKVTKGQWIDRYLLKDCTTGEWTDLSYVGDKDYWMSRFIVGGNPAVTTGIWIGSKNGGSGYRTVVSAPEPKPNLRISWLEVDTGNGFVSEDTYSSPNVFSRYSGTVSCFQEDNGKDLGYFVEKDSEGNEIGLNRGETYHARLYVKNITPPSHTTVADVPTHIDRYGISGIEAPLMALTDYDNVTNSDSIGAENIRNDAKLDGTDKADKNASHILAGDTICFEYDFQVPEDANGYYREQVTLPEEYSVQKSGVSNSGQDDFASADNDAWLIFKINPNDISMENLQFIDEEGMPTTEPNPTKQYKMRYTVKYNGGDMPFPAPVTINNITATGKNGTLFTQPGSTVTQNLQMKKGESYTFDTDYFSITEPFIKGTGTVSADIMWNEDEGKSVNNNSIEKTIQGSDWNLSIAIDSVSPQITKIAEGSTKTVSYVVNYTVNFLTPSGIDENTNIDTDIAFRVTNGNGTTYKQGMEEIGVVKGTNKFALVVEDVDLQSGNYPINFQLVVNPSRTKPVYENLWSDNLASAQAKVVIDNGSPCKRTSLNTSNSWTQDFVMGYWEKECHTNSKGKTRCHTKRWKENESKSMNESLNITKVDFTSKLENDTTNSKVDLLSNEGKIKAGYGYTLDIEFEYKTNRITNQPKERTGSSSYGYKINSTKLNTIDSFYSKNIYVELPDGQIISNTPSKGSQPYLNCTSSTEYTDGKPSGAKVKCSVKSTNTWGIKSTNKLYIDENTKDGNYKMNVCTDEIDGAPGKSEQQETLYDKKETTIKVEGSYRDDVKLHIR